MKELGVFVLAVIVGGLGGLVPACCSGAGSAARSLGAPLAYGVMRAVHAVLGS